MKRHRNEKANKHHFWNKSVILFSLASLLWFIFRTGTKPTRVVYPCQRVALANSSMLLGLSIPLSMGIAVAKTKRFLSTNGMTLALLLSLVATVVTSEQFWTNSQPVVAVNPNQELHLTLEPRNATAFPASDIFTLHGRAYAHISELVNFMGLHGWLFYKSDTTGPNRGPDGLIAYDDVVLIKINDQWGFRGQTNTDLLKELIQAIVDHPDGFVGEVVVADNGQTSGNMNWAFNNAEDASQSTQDVVSMFNGTFKVSTFLWRFIGRNPMNRVYEYSTGDMNNGYVYNSTVDAETGIRVSYPKFQTQYGTYISFKHGIWNGTEYEERLKVINMPVLKTHSSQGVTACYKHYMGVLSEERSGGFSNGHYSIVNGGMGTMLVETRYPALNIIDAIWVNANPPPSGMCGPYTPYNYATRVNVLMAGIDPIALDYWAAKHVLIQTANLIGYNDTQIYEINPDEPASNFGIRLNRTKNEILRSGYNVTSDENHMNIYVYPLPTHDIAITHIATSKTIIGEGYPLNINVTVENQGDYGEDFDLTIYANTTAIYTENITLPSVYIRFTTTTFSWNTAGFLKGNYNLTAVATVVPNETDFDDNTLTCGIVKVTIQGDVDGNFYVDISDATQIGLYWLQLSPPAPANTDINGDGIIDISDATLVGFNWLKDP